MNGLQERGGAQLAARRAVIETNIERCRDTAADNLIEMGRWLQRAKDEGIVQHGQWEDWVREHAGISARSAQRYMQAAREIPEGSAVARLGVSKAMSLLALPAGEREEFAAAIGADALSSREVDDRVKAARAERDEALRLVGEQKKKLCEMARERDALIVDARSQVSAEQAAEIDRMRAMADTAERGRLSLLDEVAAQRQRADAAQRDAAALRRQLAESQSAPDRETERKIALLESQLRSRDAAIRERDIELDRLGEELDAARTAALRSGMSAEPERCSPATMILSSIGALMASAGRSPAELARLQGLDEETRMLLAGQARVVGQWAMQILAVCGEEDGHA